MEQENIHCTLCKTSFKQRKDLLRHERTIHGDKSHKCEICNKSFNRIDILKRHKKSHEKHPMEEDEPRPFKLMKTTESNKCKSSQPSECNWCGQKKKLIQDKKYCDECSKKGRECNQCHRPMPEKYYSRDVCVCDACYTKRERRKLRGGGQISLGGAVETQNILPSEHNRCDPLLFFHENEKNIRDYLEEKIEEKGAMKWSLTLQVKYFKLSEDGREMTTTPNFTSDVFIATVSNVEEQLSCSFQTLNSKFEMFEREGSGWQMNKIIKLEIKHAKYSPISGSSYIKLPEKLQAKKAILNIQNNDDYCFKWSVLAHLHPVHWKDNPERVTNYTQFENSLDWSNISFPTPLTDIVKFEKKNNISINVFGWEKNEIFPLQITKFSHQVHINLLLISDGIRRHFCLIKNMSRLLGDRTKHNGQAYYCNYCLHGFVRQELLDSHIPYCSTNAPQRVSLPEDTEKWLKFKNHAKGLKVPFTIYADFECFLKPCSESTKQTKKYQKHVPSGFSYVVVSSDDKYTKPATVYRGENVMDEFFKHLEQEQKYIVDILSEIVPMKLTSEEEMMFQSSEKCHICESVLGTDRVRDHDHLTGRYRGAAHNACNLNYKFPKENNKNPWSFYIPVILHNLRGYDSHLIMESLGKQTNSRLTCIANNMEKYVTFSQNNFRFIDSCQFMNTSLNKLVENLAKDNLNKFKILKRHFSDEQKLELVTRKGVYPYDYITDPSKFLEQELPPKKDFF